jgi:acyl carrier protein
MFKQLSHILVTKFHVDPAALTPDTTLEALQLDSLDIVELGLTMQQELGANLSDDDLVGAQRLDAIVELAEQRVAANR